MKTNMKNAIKNFHNDEAGLEAIQVVMILAIAAVALIVVKGHWDKIKDWFDTQVKDSIDGWKGAKGAK